MRISRLLGIISIVLFVCGILSFLLPIASAIPYSGYGVSISTNISSISRNSTTVPLQISNHGFLPVNGFFLNFTAVDSSGNTISSETLGPLDLPAGATVARSFSFGIGSGNSTRTAVAEKITAKFNLAEIVPVSFSLTANLSQGNTTSSIIP